MVGVYAADRFLPSSPAPAAEKKQGNGIRNWDVGARASDGNEGRRRMVIRVIREFC